MSEAWPGRSPDAGSKGYGTHDPLAITYLLVMDDERLDRMTAFQGFGRGWEPLLWAMHALVEMPANVLEPTWPLETLIAQRIGGANHQVWRPIMASALESVVMDEIGFCVVLFTGTETAARRAVAWAAQQPRQILHVSTATLAGTIRSDRFDLLALRDHCLALYSQHAGDISPDRVETAFAALPRWTERELIPLDLPRVGHNCTTPNHMVLRRAGRVLGEAMPYWLSVHEADYTRVVLASATAVMEVRRTNGLRDWNRVYIPQPKIVLTEPALFRGAYRHVSPKQAQLAPATRMVLRRMQQQKGLAHLIEAKQVRMLQGDDEWNVPIAERQRELAIQTTGIGLMAAQSCAAVVRLRPEVNHVFPKLSELARNIRAVSAHARSKSPQLLRRVQDALAQAVGIERITFLQEHGGPVRIVADAPLELLPVDGLPLAMRYDTSRINATPGNLMMGELISRLPVVIMSDDLIRVLVVSAFALDDPLRDDMRLALEQLEKVRSNRISVDFRRVATEDEFVEAVNSSDALILIFDGHGVQDDGRGVGGLQIGTRFMDVWKLRQQMRSCPIVILSACDTHGLDAPTHATAGNSFIALGAVTVLATLLPVGGKESALFVCRVLLHLAYFVPAAIAARRRALSWTEIMAGVLRLTLAKDVLDRLATRGLLSPGSEAPIFQATLGSVLDGAPDWFGKLCARVHEAAAAPDHQVMETAIQSAIARSEAIRYIQIGTPERIIVMNQVIVDEFKLSETS